MTATSKYDGHTKGPWKLDEAITPKYAPIIFSETDQLVVCSLHYETGNGEYGAFSNIEANAALIADAPLLLAENERLKAEKAEILDVLKIVQEQLLGVGQRIPAVDITLMRLSDAAFVPSGVEGEELLTTIRTGDGG